VANDCDLCRISRFIQFGMTSRIMLTIHIVNKLAQESSTSKRNLHIWRGSCIGFSCTSFLHQTEHSYIPCKECAILYLCSIKFGCKFKHKKLSPQTDWLAVFGVKVSCAWTCIQIWYCTSIAQVSFSCTCFLTVCHGCAGNHEATATTTIQQNMEG